ncbi:hypothetical protein KY290_015548 [Solanum tuberosum]|uniref:Uncharacterized protein n=1 Tax=Solanum tuberosum TaxID=4113 RepID=A0ABQ7VST5_SOLTU|nr:hypothetical protein KY289_015194 [Solanum tuberosum]KAH0699326.1 hypothetical protein KY284_013541 [Solanum tuberosum]KAH0771567.1 hypothetical protein KY290_015548 [Solanum tuberosum]
MEVNFGEDKCVWPRRRSSESKISRTRSQKANNMMSNILDAIAKVNKNRDFSSQENEGEVVRMKIVVKKEDLKQIVEALGNGNNNMNENRSSQISSSLEQRMNFMRKRQLIRKANQIKLRNNSSWMPMLQSIPEEF